MRVLDLFCGGGGSSMGIWQASPGICIIGIDIEEQPHYPFFFMHADAMKLYGTFLDSFDFIWASPPCQAFSVASRHWIQRGKVYPNLVSNTHDILSQGKVPYCIENVPSAPIRNDVMLCGTMFGLGVLRHRIFEIGYFKCRRKAHKKHKGSVKDGDYVTVAGSGGNDAGHNYMRLKDMPVDTPQLKVWSRAMGIDWMSKKSLRQAVPPKYSEYIFNQFMKGRR